MAINIFIDQGHNPSGYFISIHCNSNINPALVLYSNVGQIPVRAEYENHTLLLLGDQHGASQWIKVICYESCHQLVSESLDLHNKIVLR